MDNKEIGKRIKSRRKELKFTLKEIADIVGVASSTIQRYESGFISQYKLPVLQSIAKAINVNPTWLVKEDAPMETGIPDDQFIKANREIIKNMKPISFTMDINDLYTPSDEDRFYTLSKEETTLLENYNKLNNLGKDKLIEYSNDLTETPKYIENTINNNTNDLITATKVEYRNSCDNIPKLEVAERKESYVPTTLAAHAKDNQNDEANKRDIEKIKALMAKNKKF